MSKQVIWSRRTSHSPFSPVPTSPVTLRTRKFITNRLLTRANSFSTSSTLTAPIHLWILKFELNTVALAATTGMLASCGRSVRTTDARPAANETNGHGLRLTNNAVGVPIRISYTLFAGLLSALRSLMDAVLDGSLCCNSVLESSSPQIQSLFTLLDVDLGGAVVPVGLDCSPIAAVQNCGAMPVLCDEPDAELGEIILINCQVPPIL
ncbi:hypothetical protein C8F01DRAFT_1373892 [Mycena amicta]|nr:hypothetical protein C8F01DRAFT_1373892 [Mycena amicta]